MRNRVRLKTSALDGVQSSRTRTLEDALRNTRRQAIRSGQAFAIPTLVIMSLGCCTVPPSYTLTADASNEIRLSWPTPPVATDRLTVFSMSGAVLWDCIAEDCLARSNFRFTYGEVPRGFRQLTPRVGSPAKLEEWESVVVVLSDRYKRENCGVANLSWTRNRVLLTPYGAGYGPPELHARVEALLGDRTPSIGR